MIKISWDAWVEKASSHIRFKPDRKAVERELLCHLADKTEALEQGGMSSYDAKKQALACMGDADEVGRQLAAVHKPWLGYLWLWSRRVLVLCIVATVFLAFGFSDRVGISDISGRYWQSAYFYQEEASQEYQYTEWTPDCQVWSDGYCFTVPAAVIVAGRPNAASNGSVGLFLTVRATRLLPLTGSCAAFRSFYAVDSLGNFYSSDDGYSDRGDEPGRVLRGNDSQTSLWSSEYHAWVDWLASDAEWIELRYDRAGRDIVLRIDLPGGEAA